MPGDGRNGGDGYEAQRDPHRRLPKRGFGRVPFQKSYHIVNLGRLQVALDAGKLKADAPVTGEALVAAGVLRRIGDGVRLLGKGELKVALTLEVAGASKSAIAAVEKLGGKVILPAAKPTEKKAGDTAKA
jgi:large subunit ribosomal protein L15